MKALVCTFNQEKALVGTFSQMKALVSTFNQKEALVGAFSVIVKLRRLIVCSSNQYEPGHLYSRKLLTAISSSPSGDSSPVSLAKGRSSAWQLGGLW